MALGELNTFMAAMRQMETRSFEGRYLQRGPVITDPESVYYGQRALGAYQIMPGNWPAWAAEAGIPGADWRSPAAQDAVARHKFTQYYRQFGDWRLVAIAWFAGPSRAARAAEEGIESVGGIRDVLGTTVAQYVTQVSDYMRQAVDEGYAPERAESVVDRLDPQASESVKRERKRTPLSIDSGEYGNVFVDLAAARPDLSSLNELIAGQKPQRAPVELGGNQMHGMISQILQGVSNAVRASATSLVSSGIDTDRFDLEVE